MKGPVWITGLGPISAVGIGRADFAEGLASGRSGVGEVQSFNPEAYGYTQAAECLDFAVEDYLESEKTYLDRCSAFTLAACALALGDAGARGRALTPERTGLILGTAYGPLDTMWAHTERVQKGGARRASSVLFLHSFVNTPIALASIEFDIQGPVACYCSGLASSGAALQFAADLIADGRADFVLAGGVDALSETLYAALDEEGRLGDDFVPGEGAALLALEAPEHAQGRGAEPLAKLHAVGLATEPGDAPRAEHEARVRTLAEAGMAESDVDRFAPPRQYGRPFGAACAMDVCAAISGDLRERPPLVSVSDPAGLGCAVIVGKP
jgi:3-oxoacyl-[acyl-carrier-protein] synthase II